MIMLLERLAQSPRAARYAPVDILPASPRKPVVKAGRRPIIGA
jgi:hypothetical protein